VKQSKNSETMPKKGGNPATLKPFKKGQSGNPKGRPKKMPALEEVVAACMGEELAGLTMAQQMFRKQMAQALKGDTRAAEFCYGYAYGKPKAPISLDTKETITVTITE
jgi:hypothetical protein